MRSVKTHLIDTYASIPAARRFVKKEPKTDRERKRLAAKERAKELRKKQKGAQSLQLYAKSLAGCDKLHHPIIMNDKVPLEDLY